MTGENATELEASAPKLLRNTVVFLDTKFFKDYTPSKSEYAAIFQHCRDGLIVLCTSHIVVEEWRTQKVNHTHKTLQDLAGGMTGLFRTNIVARKILGDVNPYAEFPDETTIHKISKEVIADFIGTNSIQQLMLTESHMNSAWDGYFHGKPPFDKAKNKTHIPDSWIYEAACEAINDPRHQTFQNRFCICEDGNLKGALQKLGWTPITLVDLLALMQAEIQALPAEASASATTEQTDAPIVTVEQQPTEAAAFVTVQRAETIRAEVEASEQIAPAPTLVSATQTENVRTEGQTTEQAVAPTLEDRADKEGLELLYTSLITDEMKDICIWILGSIHWHKGPTKERLNATLATRGFDQKLVGATIIILVQKSLSLIQDTGNHYIPIDRAICKQAADLIEADFIKLIGLG